MDRRILESRLTEEFDFMWEDAIGADAELVYSPDADGFNHYVPSLNVSDWTDRGEDVHVEDREL